VVASIALGVAWGLIAFAWLVVGPEGGWTGCNCWAADYNDWQYQVQFLVAVLGAVAALGAAVGWVLGRRRVLLVMGGLAGAAAAGWVGFLATA
jgi:hypothetical protein